MFGPAVSALALSALVEEITQGRWKLPGGFAPDTMVQIDTKATVAGMPGYSLKIVGDQYGPTGHAGNSESIQAVIAAYNHLTKGTPLPGPGGLAPRAAVPWHVLYRYHIGAAVGVLAIGGLGYWWWSSKKKAPTPNRMRRTSRRR